MFGEVLDRIKHFVIIEKDLKPLSEHKVLIKVDDT